MEYRRIPLPKDSLNDDNPCWDCCFGKEDGECNAPQEIIDSDEECGFVWHGRPYVYEIVKED